MKVSMVTVSAMAQGLCLGFHSASSSSILGMYQAAENIRLLIGYQLADMDSKTSNKKDIEVRRMGKLMRRMIVGFKARLDEGLKDHAVTMAQLRFLHEVRERPGASGARVARACFVTPQSAQAMLTRGVERGWIVRGKDPENERLVTLRLTPAGRKLLEYAEGVAQGIEAEVWAGISVKELQAVSGILERGLGNLEK